MTGLTLPFTALAAIAEREGATALVTVANARGSVPRDAGTTMLVGRASVVGTIGGGHLEFEAVRLARAALDGNHDIAPWVVRFPLAARLGQCCGGVVTLAFDVVRANAPWLAAAIAAEAAGESVALARALGRAGYLVIGGNGTTGTLHDVALEAQACTLATELLRTDAAARLVDVGGATLLVQTSAASTRHVVVFGNGHVGRALVPMLAALLARVRWVDAREEDFPRHLPDGVEVFATDAPEAELACAPTGAAIVIATHDHALDLTLVSAALARDDWSYLGLIGSRAKRQQFERRLVARGFDAASLARIVCPIGRSETRTLQGKAPGVIALATAAEIVATWQASRDAVHHAHADGSRAHDAGRSPANRAASRGGR